MSPEDPTPKIASWQADEPETLAETKVFSLHRKWAISSNDPSRCGEFVYLDVPDWVNVIALTADDRVVLIEQFRHGIQEVTLEIPGGSVDPGEAPLQGGLRELREETGYDGSDALIIGVVAPNPAIMNNRCHTVLVRHVEVVGAPQLEGYEEIQTKLVPLTDVPELIRSGAISHSLVITAFHHFDLRRSA
jgi:8-oxo-dGTP pyrophosphatase MutT (NUDIX family)